MQLDDNPWSLKSASPAVNSGSYNKPLSPAQVNVRPLRYLLSALEGSLSFGSVESSR